MKDDRVHPPHAGEENRHGTPSAVYPWSPWMTIKSLGLGIGAILVGILLFAILSLIESWWLLLVASFYLGPTALVLYLFGILCVLWGLENIGLMVSVYPEGFSLCRLRRQSFHPWTQIKAVRNANDHSHWGGKSHPLFVEYSVHLRDGKWISLRNLRDVSQLGKAIEEEAARHLLPQALAAYRSGETVDFGRLQISNRGWTKQGHTVPWDEVGRMGFDQDGRFFVERKGGPWRLWLGVSPTKMSNFRLLLKLLDEIARRTGDCWETRPAQQGVR